LRTEALQNLNSLFGFLVFRYDGSSLFRRDDLLSIVLLLPLLSPAETMLR